MDSESVRHHPAVICLDFHVFQPKTLRLHPLLHGEVYGELLGYTQSELGELKPTGVI